MSRFHLAALALQHAPLPAERTAPILAALQQQLHDAVAYIRQHLQDPPDIRDWTWT
jgi:xylulose-5-phosphate/fructose-6-phosphate phosphoketolase